MKLNSSLLDRIKAWGLPFHGLWKGGSITLPNGTMKTCPAPVGGGVVLLKVPDQPVVSRSAEEQSGDAEAGREWRNYGLLSGGRFGPAQLPSFTGEGLVFLIDGAKKCWLMRVLIAPGMGSNMTVRVRRFGLINGTTNTDWSSPISVALSSEAVGLPHPSYLADTYSMSLICQNSTGREFVMGYVTTEFDGYRWAETLCKINVTGTVDLSVAGFGLSFSHNVIQHQGSPNFTETNVSVSTGVCRHERTIPYIEYPVGGGDATGNTFTRTIVWENGVIVSDPGAPTGGTGNWEEWINHRSDTRSSTMVFSGTSTQESFFYVWAGYHDDQLKLVEMRMSKTTAGSAAASTLVGGSVWTTGDFFNNCTKRLQIKYGEAALIDESWDDVSSSSFGSVDYNASMSDASGPSPFNRNEVNNSSQGHFHYKLILAEQRKPWLASSLIKFATPFSDAWPSPVIRLASANHLSSSGALIDFSGTPTLMGFCAPNGVSAASSGAIWGKFSTWHPVTGDLVVSDDPICWF